MELVLVLVSAELPLLPPLQELLLLHVAAPVEELLITMISMNSITITVIVTFIMDLIRMHERMNE